MHLIVRVFALVLIPLLVYISVFYLHLRILTNTGPHDDLMTSAFQASLQVSCSIVSHILVYFLISVINRAAKFQAFFDVNISNLLYIVKKAAA